MAARKKKVTKKTTQQKKAEEEDIIEPMEETTEEELSLDDRLEEGMKPFELEFRDIFDEQDWDLARRVGSIQLQIVQAHLSGEDVSAEQEMVASMLRDIDAAKSMAIAQVANGSVTALVNKALSGIGAVFLR